MQQLYWELTAAFPLLEGDTLAAEMSCTLIKTNPAFSTFLHLPEPAGRLEMRAAGFLLARDLNDNRSEAVSPASVGLFQTSVQTPGELDVQNASIVPPPPPE